MSVQLHRRAEELMARAELLELERKHAQAEGELGRAEQLAQEVRQCWRQAGDFEVDAFATIPVKRVKTRGIIAISALNCFTRAGESPAVLRQAERWLADNSGLDAAARAEVRVLAERARASEPPESVGAHVNGRSKNGEVDRPAGEAGEGGRSRFSTLRPLGDRVVVRPLAAEEVTRSGIVLPDSVKEKPQQADVLSVGPGRMLDTGQRIVPDVRAGERVLFAKYSGTEITLDEDEMLILREADILAIVSSNTN